MLLSRGVVRVQSGKSRPSGQIWKSLLLVLILPTLPKPARRLPPPLPIASRIRIQNKSAPKSVTPLYQFKKATPKLRSARPCPCSCLGRTETKEDPHMLGVALPGPGPGRSHFCRASLPPYPRLPRLPGLPPPLWEFADWPDLRPPLPRPVSASCWCASAFSSVIFGIPLRGI